MSEFLVNLHVFIMKFLIFLENRSLKLLSQYILVRFRNA